jgi:hypothetical protein
MRLRASALLEQGLPSAAVGLLPSDDLLGDVAGGGIVPRASSILDHRYRAVAMGDHHLQEYPAEGDAITRPRFISCYMQPSCNLIIWIRNR